MKIRTIAAAVVVAGGTFAGFAVHSAPANASGTTLQTVTKSEHIVNSRCFTYDQVTTTYYHWSSKTGWTRYPSPKITKTHGETCH